MQIANDGENRRKRGNQGISHNRNLPSHYKGENDIHPKANHK